MKKIFSLYLSFLIIISPIILMNQANAAIGGWTLGNPVAEGASAVYDATKTVLINGKNVVKNSTIKITPTSAEVAKVLARGGATLALTVAVEQLIGAVSWVMDPANNQIVYTPAVQPVETMPKAWSYATVVNGAAVYHYVSTPQAACQGLSSYYASTGMGTSVKSVTRVNDTTYKCAYYNFNNIDTVYLDYNPTYNPNAQQEKKTLPLATVAAQVISNAQSDTDKKVGAQTATMAAAQDIVNDAESDDTKARPIATELDKNASTATDETATGEATQTKTDPTTGEPVTETTDIALEFPTFCGWAPLVCEAAQVVISIPQAVAEEWATTKEWLFADEALPDAETPNISELPIPELEENAISWSAQCPNDVDIPINLQGVSSTITFSWSPWCQLLSIIKPAIVASAYIGAAFIVLGLRT